jgi:hypothetical protein
MEVSIRQGISSTKLIEDNTYILKIYGGDIRWFEIKVNEVNSEYIVVTGSGGSYYTINRRNYNNPNPTGIQYSFACFYPI